MENSHNACIRHWYQAFHWCSEQIPFGLRIAFCIGLTYKLAAVSYRMYACYRKGLLKKRSKVGHDNKSENSVRSKAEKWHSRINHEELEGEGERNELGHKEAPSPERDRSRREKPPTEG